MITTGPGANKNLCSKSCPGTFAHSVIKVKNIVNLIISHRYNKPFDSFFYGNIIIKICIG